jgi:hypothetical protein
VGKIAVTVVVFALGVAPLVRGRIVACVPRQGHAGHRATGALGRSRVFVFIELYIFYKGGVLEF